MLSDLDLYLAFERLMIHLDQTDDQMAEGVRDLMDPIWHRLTPEDVKLLNSRGKIDPAGLFPVKMPVPTGSRLPPATVVGKRFETVGWNAPGDWKKTA